MESLTKTKVYVIIPITIPGMKKSIFYDVFKEIVEKNQWKLTKISNKKRKEDHSDTITPSTETQEPIEGQPNPEGGKIGKKQFLQKLGKTIKESEDPDYKVHFIYIEKNHPPEALQGVIEHIEENSYGIDLELVALAPLVERGFIIRQDGRKKLYYPFSQQLFLACFDRVQKRKNHEVLNGNGAESAQVCMFFLKSFTHFHFNKKNLSQYGFSKVLKVPFTSENPVSIPKELTDSLMMALKSKKKDANHQANLENLNSIYERLQIRFDPPEVESVKKHIEEFIMGEILPYITPNSILSLESDRLQTLRPINNNADPSHIGNKPAMPSEEGRKIEKKKEEVSPVITCEIQYNYKSKRAQPL